ncbi:MAG: M4 family metallopeptidase [Bdellovibrionales bacterium]|nr:M4 family metallopeptidase [Bdellovibrionales bacterium]
MNRINSVSSAQEVAKSFVRSNLGLLSLNGAVRMNVAQEIEGIGLKTVRLKKTWNNIEVRGGTMVVHVAEGSVKFASGDATDLSSLSPVARLSKDEAASIAFSAYPGQAAEVVKNEMKVLLLNRGERKEPRLTHAVSVSDRDGVGVDTHYIDAQDGSLLMATTNVHTIKQRKIFAGVGSQADFSLDESRYTAVYEETGCKPENGVLGGIFGQGCKLLPGAILKSARSAWNNSGLVFDYFRAKHGRNSIDDAGMTLKSVVNFGSKFNNAAWVDGKGLMIYGMGDNQRYNDFASALDVAGHELTHGVTSRTANLEYVGESGALNESYSDVFGKLVAYHHNQTSDWKLGKELFKDGKGAIRDMERPLIGHYDDYRYKGEPCSKKNDWCGVHTNSGIPNRAAVMLAKEIGLEKVGKLYYAVLTQLLRENSGFREARAQTEAACAAIWSAHSGECSAVAKAFTAVGI